MSDKTRPSVSEITQDTGAQGDWEIRAFFSATLRASIAGATALIILAIVTSDIRPLEGLVPSILFAVVFSGFIAFCGMVVFALPLTAILARANLEKQIFYVSAGGLLGLIANYLMFDLGQFVVRDNWIFTLAGGFAGFVAGHRWGRWRQSEAQRKFEAAEISNQPNPIHDLIY